MIWIGTSGWCYPHWIERFYPSDLPAHEYLAYYARHFSTAKINNSFSRLPTYEQVQCWSEQVQGQPDFCFAVKANHTITHLKKLQKAEEQESWIRRLRAMHQKGRDVFVYFNNDAEGYAIAHAQYVQKALKDVLPEARGSD